MKKLIKLSVVLALFAMVIGTSFKTRAYPAYLRQALKFGAKNCLFCHTHAQGGEGWNARGQWLIDQKDKRKADEVDVEWLAEYKEGGATVGEKKEGEAKVGEKKEGEAKAGEKKEGEATVGEKKEGESGNNENGEGEKSGDGHDGHDDQKDGEKADPKDETKKVKKTPKVQKKKPVQNPNSTE